MEVDFLQVCMQCFFKHAVMIYLVVFPQQFYIPFLFTWDNNSMCCWCIRCVRYWTAAAGTCLILFPIYIQPYSGKYSLFTNFILKDDMRKWITQWSVEYTEQLCEVKFLGKACQKKKKNSCNCWRHLSMVLSKSEIKTRKLIVCKWQKLANKQLNVLNEEKNNQQALLWLCWTLWLWYGSKSSSRVLLIVCLFHVQPVISLLVFFRHYSANSSNRLSSSEVTIPCKLLLKR